MRIKITDLREQIVGLLKANLTDSQAAAVADYLVWAEMTNNKTQGIVKMIGTEPIQSIVPEAEMKVVKDTKLSQIIDAGKNPAPLSATRAMDTAIQKANEHGFAIVGVRNTFSSNGAQAYYVEKIAREGLIGIMMSRSPAAASAFGGIEPVFGTNPIGIAFPTNDDPLVFDAATSAMTFYGLVLAKTRGEQIAEGVALDREGNETTDPAAVMDGGSIRPFDKGYKGSGFAMLVEVLGGPLLSGAWIDNKTFDKEWGTVVMVIDPDLMAGREEFKANVSDMIAQLKSARTKSGDTVRLPGETSKAAYHAALDSGELDIDDAVAKTLGIH